MAVGDNGGEELAVILNRVFCEERFVMARAAGVVRARHILRSQNGLHPGLGEGRGDVKAVEGGVSHLGKDGISVEGTAIQSDVVGVESLASDVTNGRLVGVGELIGDCYLGSRDFIL